jgi:membrane protein CcdC involved in cytochrome C biogenesis
VPGVLNLTDAVVDRHSHGSADFPDASRRVGRYFVSMQLQALFGSAASLVGAGVMIAMSTGFCMFFAPQTRFPFSWGLIAFLVGAGILAVPLAHTSRLEREGEVIMMRRSPAFLVILLVLVAIRFALRSYIDQFISPLETGALFFVLAFGMILRWRVAMLIEYRRLARRA